MRSGRGKGEEKYVWALSTAPARNVGMTNQIAVTHKLHSTKSTIGFQEAWNGCVIESSDKTRIQHAAPPARKSSQGICAGKGRVCEPSNWQREVTLLLCCSISAYSSFVAFSLFLWLSVAAHVQRRRK